MVKRVSVSVASGRGVAERWRTQYQRDGKWTTTVSGDSKKVYERLCKLGENPDIDVVAGIIGNKGWAHLSCNGCGDYVVRAANLTREYSDNENLLCEACLKDGLAALTK